MKFKQQTIGPKEAERLLATSRGNRLIRQTLVKRYAREMSMGTWHESPEPLMIDERGALVNGHHRLQAVILSDTTQVFWVATGVPKQTVPKVDTGGPRSLSDRLGHYSNDRAFKRIVDGHPKRNRQAAAIVNFFYKMLTGEKGPSTEEALRIARKFEDSMTRALRAAGGDNLLHRSPTLAALTLMHHACESQRHHDVVDNFVQSVSSGELLARGDAAYALRQYLLTIPKSTANRRSSAHRDSPWMMFVKTLRAMQAEFEGEKIIRLQPPKSGSRGIVEYFFGDETSYDLVRSLRLGPAENRGQFTGFDDEE